MHLGKKVGLFYNTEKERAKDIAHELIKWGPSVGIDFLMLENEALNIGASPTSEELFFSEILFAVVIGGDGTFLRAARVTMKTSIALYGVNVGTLGFLVPGRPERVKNDILAILRGESHRLNRYPLVAAMEEKKDQSIDFMALNECVISKGVTSRPAEFEVCVNGRVLCVFIADGLIVSTPTGSTAYALSAGGPIVPPHVECLLLVPICAHALYSKPFVLGRKDRISVQVWSLDQQSILSFDGHSGTSLAQESRVEFRLDLENPIPTLHLKEQDYYGLLQEKLRWGTSVKRNRGGYLA